METLQEFGSRHRISWIIWDFRETCVLCSLKVCLETKMLWTPSRKKKDVVFTTLTTRAYQDQLNTGFSFSFHGLESLKYIREFYTPLCYCGDITMPRNVTLNETNCDWLFHMSVKRPHGRALANKACHGFQTFSRQSRLLIQWLTHKDTHPFCSLMNQCFEQINSYEWFNDSLIKPLTWFVPE